ncbi:MAG TPA: hypothetical protein VHI54_03105 [Actinomycetota bacterium]|nr:hypothetical protein [Actinomycetota bacterium]
MSNRRSQIRWGTLFFLYFSLITVPNANAYIDPASGSFLFQVTIGAILGAGLAIKMFWRRIWGFLTGRTRRERAEAAAAAQAPAEPRTEARTEATADRPA